MKRADQTKLIYTGKYPLPLDSATKKSYKILIYRSTIESGTIENIEKPELPENYYIIDAADLKGRNEFKLNGVKIPVLADKEVNYIGEPILIILGSEIPELKKIYKKIKITYIHKYETEESQNIEKILFSRSVESLTQDVDIKSLYKSVSGTINTPASIIPVKYLHGSFTKRDSDTLINYSSTIWESNLRDNIAAISGMDAEKIRIITPTMTGENQFPLLDSYKSSLFTCLAASIIKKNVLFSPTPEDQYLYSSKIYGLNADWKINFDRENRVLGIEIHVKIDCGAYPIFVKEKVLRVIHGVTSFYKHRNVKISVDAVKSNKPPCGLTNDMYLSDAQFIAELITSKIIEESGEDQLNWRLEHILKRGYRNSSNSIIKRDIPLEDMLKNVAFRSDFSRKNASNNLSLLRGDRRVQHSKRKGIGISIGYNGNGFISNDKTLMTSSVTIELKRDNSAELRLSCRVNNLTLISLWEEIISETLSVERDAITVYTNDTTMIEDSAPNIGNKNISVLTPLVRQCCDDIKARRFKDPLPISECKQTRRKSAMVWNPDQWKGVPFKNSSYAACAVEVELDRRSLRCRIKEIWMEVEVGQIIDESALKSSLTNEIVRTIKWLQEPQPEIIDGKFSEKDFYNRSIVVPNPIVNINFYETGKNKNLPKGAGSLVTGTLPGAYIQAINQALGSNLRTFPVLQETIYRELKKDEV